MLICTGNDSNWIHNQIWIQLFHFLISNTYFKEPKIDCYKHNSTMDVWKALALRAPALYHAQTASPRFPGQTPLWCQDLCWWWGCHQPQPYFRSHLDPKACYTLQEKLWPFYPAPKENKFVISKHCQHFLRPKMGGGGLVHHHDVPSLLSRTQFHMLSV